MSAQHGKQFNPERPNATWCSDITYIWTTDGFVCLTSIMDLYSRRIIAWTLSRTLEASCVIDPITKAKARRKIDAPLITISPSDFEKLYEKTQKNTLLHAS